MTMSIEDNLSLLLGHNHGYFTTKEAAAQGIDRWALTRLVQDGKIARVAQGLYTHPDAFPDPFVVTQHRCAIGVFSHETALYLHDLSDRLPLQLMMTIPSGWNSPLLKDDGLVFFYNKKTRFEMGLSSVQTKAGPQVRCYDVERTLCDCIRSIDRLDRDMVLTAMKSYMRQSGRNRAKLLEYAGVFGIRDTMYQYMEVLS
jgi:predicted transcriptional regulator of viral defense system